jgi:hypothetical protein
VISRAVEVSNLYFLFTEVTDKHEDEDNHSVAKDIGEAVFDPKSYHLRSNHHEEDAAWSQNRTNQQGKLREKKSECVFFFKKLVLLLVNFESHFSQKNLVEARGV